VFWYVGWLFLCVFMYREVALMCLYVGRGCSFVLVEMLFLCVGMCGDVALLCFCMWRGC